MQFFCQQNISGSAPLNAAGPSAERPGRTSGNFFALKFWTFCSPFLTLISFDGIPKIMNRHVLLFAYSNSERLRYFFHVKAEY